MSRAPLLLATAAVLVGGLMLGLWLLIGRAPAPAPDVVATPRPTPVAAPAPVAARDSSTPARSPRSRPATTDNFVRSAPSRAPSGEAPAIAAAAPDDASPPQNLRRQVSDQVRATEDALLECNDRALKAGHKLDGVAAMGFTLTRRGDKVVAEPTTIEYSTITDPELVECMRLAARSISIEALPDGAETVTAYRKVVLQQGNLIENWMTDLHVAGAP